MSLGNTVLQLFIIIIIIIIIFIYLLTCHLYAMYLQSRAWNKPCLCGA
jgi:hypothetical protein